MNDTDAEAILEFCKENTQYYEYCQAESATVRKEQTKRDLQCICRANYTAKL